MRLRTQASTQTGTAPRQRAWPGNSRRRATTEPALAPPQDLEFGHTELAHTDMAQPDDDAAEAGPLRRCIVRRERLAKERMIRFVVGPDRAVVPDLAARLPGRGIWLSAARDVVETARLRGAFAKAAAARLRCPPTFWTCCR